MTYDYGDWADEDYGAGETAVTFTFEVSPDDDDPAVFITQALSGDVRLSFTLAPQDTLDFLARFLRFTGVDLDEVRRVTDEAEEARRLHDAR